ncbi:MAG: globin domain-containing protein [Mangrovicoccus sp.]
MLTQREIDLIRNSWMVVALDAEDAGRYFYETLFQLAPEIQPLFHNNIEIQSRKLVETLATVVDLIDDLDRLAPIAGALARRHADYGVVANQYAVVGEALIRSLKAFGGDRMTPECVAAWTKAYGILQNVMINAAYGSSAKSA